VTSGTAPGRWRQSSPSEAEIERQIGEARARIGSAIDALACRLAPHRLLHRGAEMWSQWFGAGDSNRHLDRLGLGLIAAGVAAIIVANSARWRRREAVEAEDEAADVDAELRGDEDRERPSDASGPLIFAVLGFAAGATVALLLPPSRGERRAVGEAREELWRKAEGLGHELAARIRSLGRGAAAAQAPPPVREGDER
jgi:hypothetical protein